jgi:hypothetical protein
MEAIIIIYNSICIDHFPLEELNLMEGTDATIDHSGNITLVLDTKIYNSPESFFQLGRYIEVSVANKQLKISQGLIKTLLNQGS